MTTGEGNHLEEILHGLVDAGVDFIVCGGVAVVLQGGERLTVDLDISADLSPDSARRLVNSMEALGLVPRAPVPAETICDPEAVKTILEEKGALVFTFLDPDNPFRQVDVFLAPEHAYHQLLPHSEQLELGGKPVRVLTRTKLLEMKRAIQPPRDRDRLDIAVLERLLAETSDGG